MAPFESCSWQATGGWIVHQKQGLFDRAQSTSVIQLCGAPYPLLLNLFEQMAACPEEIFADYSFESQRPGTRERSLGYTVIFLSDTVQEPTATQL